MSRINSRAKGARGELEFRDELKKRGFGAIRGAQASAQVPCPACHGLGHVTRFAGGSVLSNAVIDMCEQCKGSGRFNAPDIVTELPFHFEVKRCERIEIPKWVKQAKKEAPNGMPWIIVFRKNREKQWLACTPIDTILDLVKERNDHE
jgi:DnaJ-class molecular chaperone